MDLVLSAWHYVADNRDNLATFVTAVQIQVALSAAALGIALAVCVPLGILAARSRLASLITVNLFSTARVIPSIAILFLALPLLGAVLGYGNGFALALVPLTVLACPPILVNTSAGFSGVDAAVVESARGMGMSGRQVLGRIELPLALPVVLAGIRIAAVEVIASATLATFIGGGGLGDFIAQGFSNFGSQPYLMLVGGIPVALLALCSELLFGGLQRLLSPRL